MESILARMNRTISTSYKDNLRVGTIYVMAIMTLHLDSGKKIFFWGLATLNRHRHIYRYLIYITKFKGLAGDKKRVTTCIQSKNVRKTKIRAQNRANGSEPRDWKWNKLYTN